MVADLQYLVNSKKMDQVDVREQAEMKHFIVDEKGGMNAVNLRVAEQYINEFGNLAKTNNTIIIPSNLSDIAGMIKSVTTVIKDKAVADTAAA